MQAFYERNIPALSKRECALLGRKKILVAGCGGLGGYIIEYLARLGAGSIVCVDGDVFEESNLNRQLLSESALIGTSKAEAAKARVKRIRPEADVRAMHVRLDEANAASVIEGCDAVLDGLDSIPARKMLAAACEKAGIPFIYGAIRGWVSQAAVCMPGDGLIDRLYPENARISDKSVLSFTPALCAAMQVSLCARLLCGRPVERGKLYYFDLSEMEFETIPLR